MHQVFSKPKLLFNMYFCSENDNTQELWVCCVLASSPWIQTLLDAWSTVVQLLDLAASFTPSCLTIRSSWALLPGRACCTFWPLHMLCYTSPSMLQSYYPTAWICMYVQVLSFCPSVQCRWMQNWFCCLIVDEFILTGDCVHEVLCCLVCRGSPALGPLRAAAASQPSVTDTEGHFKM